MKFLFFTFWFWHFKLCGSWTGIPGAGRLGRRTWKERDGRSLPSGSPQRRGRTDSEGSQLEGGAQEDSRGVGTIGVTLLGKDGGRMS